MSQSKISQYVRGFTLIEVMVSIGVFVLLALVVYQTTAATIKLAELNREKTTVAMLADQYMEIAHNLPYAQVGTLTGNPNGALPDNANAVSTTYNNKSYSIYFEVTYVDDPADGRVTITDVAPNDYKQVKLSIVNQTNGVTSYFITNLVPKGLEGMSSGGALSIQVIDAIGQPVAGATITITNTALSSPLNLTRTSDANGKWIEVGLPNSANSYHIVVTKSGYSTDNTTPISVSNPSPTKPDSTISNGQITTVSFAIDKLSSLAFSTENSTCSAIGGVNLAVQGSKLIGTPNLLKFNNTYTSSGSGLATLSQIEWDTYTPALTGASASSYMIYGSSPIQQINLLPDTSQTFTLILGPKTTNSQLVIVKDSATGNPIEGASVTLSNASLSYTSTAITGGSLWSQQSWSGGSGQAAWSNISKYFSDDGGVSTSSGIRLASSGGSTVVTNGSLISSTFDTGTPSSSFTTLTWQPTSQVAGTTVKFQLASNNDNTTWNFVGPDGTAATYYTVSGTSIASVHNNNQYMRYKAYLSTTNSSLNPVISSVSINYVSGCFTPGQVMFPGLTSSSSYDISVSMPGYTTKVLTNVTISGYNAISVLLSP